MVGRSPLFGGPPRLLRSHWGLLAACLAVGVHLGVHWGLVGPVGGVGIGSPVEGAR